MRVRMKVSMSGTREGKDWPERGSIVDLPAQEARQYISAGMAEAVPEFRDAETAVVPKAEERADEEGSKGLTTKTGPVKQPQRKSLRDSK